MIEAIKASWWEFFSLGQDMLFFIFCASIVMLIAIVVCAFLWTKEDRKHKAKTWEEKEKEQRHD